MKKDTQPDGQHDMQYQEYAGFLDLDQILKSRNPI